MEKARGVILEAAWSKMDLEGRLNLIKAVARLSEDWANASFTGYGSLYCAADLPSSVRHRRQADVYEGPSNWMSKFAIGTTTGQSWATHGRLDVDFDRGPCE